MPSPLGHLHTFLRSIVAENSLGELASLDERLGTNTAPPRMLLAPRSDAPEMAAPRDGVHGVWYS